MVVLVELQVVSTQLHTENYCCNPLETVDPLFAFRSLPTHVHHFESQLFEGELIFYNARGHVPRAQNVFHRGDVVQGRDPLQVVQVVGSVVLQVVLVGAAKALLHPRVHPQPLHDSQQLRGDLPFALSWACQGKELHSIIGSVRVVEFDLEGGQSPDDPRQGVDRIVDNQRLVLLAGLQVKATTVDYFHLLDNGALARIAGAQQQELDLPALALALRAQVAVNPARPPRCLFLLRALPTSHGIAGGAEGKAWRWSRSACVSETCRGFRFSCQGLLGGRQNSLSSA